MSGDTTSSSATTPASGEFPGSSLVVKDIVFAETVRISWWERLKGAFGGMVMGCILIVAAIALLFWNEGRAVQTARSLTEGAEGVIAVAPGMVDPAHQGQLVHVIAPIRPAHRIGDDEFFFKADAVRLVRKVQMYQWREETRSESRRSVGGSEETTTQHTYTRFWSESRLESARFKRPEGHHNPEFRYRARDILAPQTTIGAFKATDSLLKRMVAEEEFAVPTETLVHLRQRHGVGVHIVDGRIHLGSDPANPRIGDMIVSYTQVRPQTVSVVARQIGDSLGEFQTQAGDSLMMIVPGEVAAAAMFAQAGRDNSMATWFVRAGGALMMMLGFGLIGRPFAVFADLIPLAGDILRVGLGFAAFALTAFLAPLVIALAWLWSRPLLALGIVIAGFAVLAAMYGIGVHRRRLARA